MYGSGQPSPSTRTLDHAMHEYRERKKRERFAELNQTPGEGVEEGSATGDMQQPLPSPNHPTRSRGMSLDWVLTPFRRDRDHPEPLPNSRVSGPVLQRCPDNLPFSLVHRHHAANSPTALTPRGSEPSSPAPEISVPTAHRVPPVLPTSPTFPLPARSQSFDSYLHVSEDTQLQLFLSDQSHGNRPTPCFRKELEDTQERRHRRKQTQPRAPAPKSTGPYISAEQAYRHPEIGLLTALRWPAHPGRPPPLPPSRSASSTLALTKRQDSGFEDNTSPPAKRVYNLSSIQINQVEPFPDNTLRIISEISSEREYLSLPRIPSEHIAGMTSLRPESLRPPAVGTKARAIQQAREMEQFAAERAKRSGDEPPPYDFLELIGKGAYGRVFKGYGTLDTLQWPELTWQ